MNKLISLLLSCIVFQGLINAMERYPLCEAAEAGDMEQVNALLANGIDINRQDSFGRTPLSWAVFSGHDVIVQVLLEKGAQANLPSNAGKTPLHWAAIKGRKAIVQLLLDNGANINLEDDLGWTPLRWAASKGEDAIVQLFLEEQESLQKTFAFELALFDESDKNKSPLFLLPGDMCLSKEIVGCLKKLIPQYVPQPRRQEPQQKNTSTAELYPSDINQKDDDGEMSIQRQNFIKQQKLSFLMGLHSRLGEDSPVNSINGCIVMNIFKFLNK